FESILEGLFGSGLIDNITLFQDCEPTEVSDWSFDENCLFCCSRREKKVKVRPPISLSLCLYRPLFSAPPLPSLILFLLFSFLPICCFCVSQRWWT
ncbi:unnamed protein product, partial [Boreogadus saida]